MTYTAADHLVERIISAAYHPHHDPHAQLANVRKVLEDAGMHHGQVDAEGFHVPPPHDDDCAWCGPREIPKAVTW